MELQWKFSSILGPLYLVAAGDKLTGILWRAPSVAPLGALAEDRPEAKVIKKAVGQIEEYLAGHRREFDLPLEPAGTEFQRRVWAELKKIPYGQTLSYREIAGKIENEKAVRAVGTANGRNPLSLVIPCHRVIAADGTLGGYAGGLDVKKRLLELEGAKLSSQGGPQGR